MSVFIDTPVLYAHHDENHPDHETVRDAFDVLLDGQLGRLYTSDYVYDEVVTLAAERTDQESARELGKRLRGAGDYPSVLEFEHLTTRQFSNATTIFDRYDESGFSFTDATTVAVMEDTDIEYLVTPDEVFDGLVDRVPPKRIAQET